jgi:hypothetical protein
MRDIEFLRLTTDICYIIGGFFGGMGPDGKLFTFMHDSGETVYLDMDEKMIFHTHNITRLQSFALEQVAKDHELGIDLYNDEDE